MRICYLNYEWDLQASTGAATQIAQTVAGLERLGHQVVVVDRHRKSAGFKSGKRLTPWSWETMNHLRSLRGVGPEMEILRRERPDAVLILHALRFSGIVAARRLGLPVVLQVNASVPYEFRQYRPGMRLVPGISDYIEKRSLLAADGVFVVSAALRDYFAALGIPRDSIAVIPNGADTTLFHPGAADLSLRAKFPGQTLVGFAGSFASFHGLDLLEYAVSRAPDLHFVFAGSGKGAGDLRKRCDRRGWEQRVTFLGYLSHDRMPSMLAAMDVLLAPYLPHEIFYFSPIKLFEYMACGRAVLAARLGQIAEVIEDGQNGVVYDPASPEDFVSKLTELASNPSRRLALGEEARRTIENYYTWDHAALRINEVLELACLRRAL